MWQPYYVMTQRIPSSLVLLIVHFLLYYLPILLLTTHEYPMLLDSHVYYFIAIHIWVWSSSYHNRWVKYNVEVPFWHSLTLAFKLKLALTNHVTLIREISHGKSWVYAILIMIMLQSQVSQPLEQHFHIINVSIDSPGS